MSRNYDTAIPPSFWRNMRMVTYGVTAAVIGVSIGAVTVTAAVAVASNVYNFIVL